MQVTWESVAMVTAVFVGVGSLLRILMNKDKQEITANIQKAVIESNGVPSTVLNVLPFPAWYKDNRGVMRYINSAYTLAFKVRPEQYIGRRDHEVWGKVIGDQFTKHDQEVLDKGVMIQFIEKVPARVGDKDAPMEEWFVEKFPHFDEVTKEIKGVGGYAIPPDTMQKMRDREKGVWIRKPQQQGKLF